MPYTVHWKKNGIFKKFTGLVTGREILESSIEVEKDPRFDDLEYAISDFCHAESVETTKEEMEVLKAIVCAAALTNSNIRLAIVACHAETRALAKEYIKALDQDPHITRIFDSLEDAHHWAESGEDY